jgi:hypothetical protein
MPAEFFMHQVDNYYKLLITVASLLCLGKVVPVLNYLNTAMKIWGGAGIAPPFLTSTLDGGELSASRPGHFNLRERAFITHWIGGWVGPRDTLDAVEMRKILHCRKLNPGRLTP